MKRNQYINMEYNIPTSFEEVNADNFIQQIDIIKFNNIDYMLLKEKFPHLIFKDQEDRFYIEDIMKNINIALFKTEDEWFFIRRDDMASLMSGCKYFKCDQLHGLIDCISYLSFEKYVLLIPTTNEFI